MSDGDASPPALPIGGGLVAYASDSSASDDERGGDPATGPVYDGAAAFDGADVTAPYPDSPTPIPSDEEGEDGGEPATAPYPPSPQATGAPPHPPPPSIPPSLAAPPPGLPPPALVDRVDRMLAAIASGAAPTLAAALRGSRAYTNPAFLETLVAAAGPPDPHACPLPWWRGAADLPAEDSADALDKEEAAARATRAGQARSRIDFHSGGRVRDGGGGAAAAAAAAAAVAAARAAAARASTGRR